MSEPSKLGTLLSSLRNGVVGGAKSAISLPIRLVRPIVSTLTGQVDGRYLDRAQISTKEGLAELESVSAQSHFVSVHAGGDELKLHVVTAGPKSGTPCILLHGFPEFWYTYRMLIEQLSRAGFFVIVPDQRGYNLSDAPSAVSKYRGGNLVEDVREVLEHFGVGPSTNRKAILFCHDWGGAIGYQFAMDHPDYLSKVVAMNAPHPKMYSAGTKKGWKHLFMLIFQLPYLPEAMIVSNSQKSAKKFLLDSAVTKDHFTPTILAKYSTAWDVPGRMTGMMNWYRALPRYEKDFKMSTIEHPTLLLWGRGDEFLSADMADIKDFAPNSTTIFIDKCGHWVQNEAPDQIWTHIEPFISSSPPSSSSSS
mmetsp:Transcript_50466/g.130046  ORF Transcript_50466/g.130046 Transcript_50466/m.130046 type:complete len:364 (-) Transcript_50466:216-1307(-)